jgi:uroporphyrinogen decarboxylase
LNLREKYGEDLAFFGNISVPKMSGPIDELEQEIKSKLTIAKNGGYIFHSDHSLPPDVSLDRYQWMLKTARQCFSKI